MSPNGTASNTWPPSKLAAFFAVRGYAAPTNPKSPAEAAPFFAVERKTFGIVHIRTDGHRVLAFTHSGKRGMNEAYGFTVDGAGKVRMSKRLTAFRG